jgi:hypothetical protein
MRSLSVVSPPGRADRTSSVVASARRASTRDGAGSLRVQGTATPSPVSGTGCRSPRSRRVRHRHRLRCCLMDAVPVVPPPGADRSHRPDGAPGSPARQPTHISDERRDPSSWVAHDPGIRPSRGRGRNGWGRWLASERLPRCGSRPTGDRASPFPPEAERAAQARLHRHAGDLLPADRCAWPIVVTCGPIRKGRSDSRESLARRQQAVGSEPKAAFGPAPLAAFSTAPAAFDPTPPAAFGPQSRPAPRPRRRLRRCRPRRREA